MITPIRFGEPGPLQNSVPEYCTGEKGLYPPIVSSSSLHPLNSSDSRVVSDTPRKLDNRHSGAPDTMSHVA